VPHVVVEEPRALLELREPPGERYSHPGIASAYTESIVLERAEVRAPEDLRPGLEANAVP
jgi:hypothetical protein